jgi:hypothetical protein
MTAAVAFSSCSQQQDNTSVIPPAGSIVTGRVPNTPKNLVHWIRYPRRVDEDTAMPYMNVSEEHARGITAFLYTLR